MARVEIVLYRVIIGRGGYYHEVGILVCRRSVKGGCQVKILFRQVFLDIVVLYRGFALVYQVYFFRYDVNRRYLVVLA